jgi:hypothetical protein
LHLLNAILLILRAKKVRCLLCAPTGRAAKRLCEATGVEAKTIHRLLEVQPVTGVFTRNEGRPLETDRLVADEMSMVDVPLMPAYGKITRLARRARSLTARTSFGTPVTLGGGRSSAGFPIPTSLATPAGLFSFEVNGGLPVHTPNTNVGWARGVLGTRLRRYTACADTRSARSR